MMILIHNEISNAVGLDRDLELIWRCMVEVDSKERNDKKELKNKVMQNGPKGIYTANQREISKLILHDHAKFSHGHAKWNRIGLAAAHKGNVKSGFALPCEIFAQSCKMLQQDENAVDGFSTSHHHAKLLGAHAKMYFLQVPWWRSLRKTSKMLLSVLLTLAYK